MPERVSSAEAAKKLSFFPNSHQGPGKASNGLRWITLYTVFLAPLTNLSLSLKSAPGLTSQLKHPLCELARAQCRKEAQIHFQTPQVQKQLENAAMLIKHLLGNHNINKWELSLRVLFGGQYLLLSK